MATTLKPSLLILPTLLLGLGALGGCGDVEGSISDLDNPKDALSNKSSSEDKIIGLMAGAAERGLSLPIGLPQGGYTSRMFPLSLPVDNREAPYTTQFIPSAGVATRVPVKVLWLQQDDAPMVFVKVDLIYAFEGLLFNIEDAITEATGVDVHDRVVLATNHSHASYGDHSQDAAMYLGSDQFNREIFERMTEEVTEIALEAFVSREPASIGVGFDPDFDPIGEDRIFRSRRSENNDLIGVDGEPLGPGYKDARLTVLRVDHSQGTADASDDEPIGVLFHFGMHGTVLGGDNPFLSTDAPGAVELKFQETFDSEVVVMHMQGGAGDVSPAGSQSDWARLETIGEIAAPRIHDLWDQTETRVGGDIGLDMVTSTITQAREEMVVTRGGTTDLRYSPYRTRGRPDNIVYNEDGSVKSPIDEFNTEVGAALCGSDVPVPGYLWSVGASAYPYQSCAEVEPIVGILNYLNFDLSWAEFPVQSAQQTVVSVSRLSNIPVTYKGAPSEVSDFVMGFFPGEGLTLFSDTFRHEVEEYYGYEHSISVSYAQDHEGYLLTVEDWLAGGYEPSINQWGPLQGEYILEQAVALVDVLDGAPPPATVIPDRDWAPTLFPLEPIVPEITIEAGSVPPALPTYMFTRTGEMPTQAQPLAEIPRVTGVASFVWLGGDPTVDMPEVLLEREVGGSWEPVVKESGRQMNDNGYEMFVAYTPDPLQSSRDRKHYYQAEWQAVTDEPSLAHMAGLPLGRYRFRVEGRAVKGSPGTYPWTTSPYTAISSPFTVTASDVTVSTTGPLNATVVTAAYPASPQGWRLLSMTSNWNTPTGLVSGDNPLTARLTITDGSGAELLDVSGVSFSISGDGANATLDLSFLSAGTYTLTITDTFGNSGATTLNL